MVLDATRYRGEKEHGCKDDSEQRVIVSTLIIV